jgi:hypothetical protein
MGVMTGNAFFLCIEPPMLHGGFPGFFLFVGMTVETELLCTFRGKEEFEIRAVGIVAAHTCFLHRGMGKFLPLEFLGLVGMAVKTYLIPLGRKELGEIALMHSVAGTAAPGCNGAMDKLAADQGAFVTEEAEIGPCRTKLEFIG